MHSAGGTYPSHMSLVIDNPQNSCGFGPDEHDRVARLAVNGTVRLALTETYRGFPMAATLEVHQENPQMRIRDNLAVMDQ